MARLLIITEYEERHIYDVISGIKDYVLEKNVPDPTICTISKGYVDSIGMKGLVEWCREWKVDCVLGSFSRNDDTDLLADSGIIAVNWNSMLMDTGLPSIRTDHTTYGRICVKHFSSYRHFAFYSHTNDPRIHSIIQGFQKVLEDKPSATFDHFIFDPEADFRSELMVLKAWLRNIPKPVLILAGTDMFGNNLIEYCKVLNIDVPGKIAILGIGNSKMICDMKLTSLSSIDMNMYKVGWRIAEMMDICLKNRNFKGYDIINRPGRVIERMSTATIPSANQDVVEAARFIHLHFHQKISVDDVVQATSISRRLLEKHFAAECGMGIYQYIMKLRLDEFTEKVMHTKEPIKSIAISLGDDDSKNLSRMFREKYGCSPSSWREANTLDD